MIMQRCPKCKVLRDTRLDVCPCGSDALGKRKDAGTAIYWVVIKRRGKQIRKSPRDYDLNEHSYEDAKKCERMILAELDKGNTGILDKKPQQADWTWDELVQWYVESTSPTLVRSLKGKKQKLKSFCDTKINGVRIGSKRVDSLTVADLRKFKDTRMGGKDPLRLSTIIFHLEAAQRCVKLGIEEKWFQPDVGKPFTTVLKEWRTEVDNIQQLHWSPEQVKAIAENLTHPKVRLIMEIAMTTGMRVMEVAGLTWNRISPDFTLIEMTKSTTKTKRQRFVPLPPWVQQALKEWPNVSTFVFPSRLDFNQHITHESIRQIFKKACEKAGVPYGRYNSDGGTFHHLRKYWYTMSDQSGISDATIRLIVGHTSNFMEKHYRHFSQGDIENLATKLWPKQAEVSTMGRGLSHRLSLPAPKRAKRNTDKG